MRIGIDARLIEETGVGRYIRNLLSSLAKLDTENEYIVFLPAGSFDSYILPNERWQKRLVTIHWHTIAEQLVLPFVFAREKLDLLHVPYFTVPLLYFGKVVMTVHDITILNFRTGKATTLPFPFYYIKWLAYKFILSAGVRKSVSVIAVSNTVKNDLQRVLKVPESKIFVTYEGVDPSFIVDKGNTPRLNYQYFLYVGNVYPHKQAEFLIRCYEKFIYNLKQYKAEEIPKLVFVGKHDFFYKRLEKEVKQLQIADAVIFMSGVSDKELRSIYRNAVALLFPSAMEGFGLPALEAIAQDCHVLVSNIPVFHELLGDFAQYSDHDEGEWCRNMIELWHSQAKQVDQEKKKIFLSKYSWSDMAEKTKKIYEGSFDL